MKLEDLCVSLELAKELKENGYPQETFFYWRPKKLEEYQPYEIQMRYEFGDMEGMWGEHTFAAPTVSEIGGQIQVKERDDNGNALYDYYTYGQNSDNQWYAQVTNGMVDTVTEEFTDSKEASSRAKLWLHLKQHNLLKENL